MVAYYVLKDWASNDYLTNRNGEIVLPKQLVNKNAYTGFVSDANGTKFYSTSGYQLKIPLSKMKMEIGITSINEAIL